MRIFGKSRYALSISAVATFLAGCGASQPPIGASGATPQASKIATHGERGKSWMLPGATSADLLYVSKLTKVLIYSYPTDKVVGVLTGFESAAGLCSDRDGNVWVADSRTSQVSEYAHAGTKPIAILTDEQEPVACAVDPLSGDLAVANYTHNFFVYSPGSGNPEIYTAPDFYYMEFCNYDGSGNLFVDGYRATHQGLAQPAILKLSYGSAGPQRFNLKGRWRTGLRSAGGLQWDGKGLVVGQEGEHRNDLYRISDLGQFGKIKRRVKLAVPDGGYFAAGAPILLYRGTVIATYIGNTEQVNNIGFWPYPQGGAAVREFEVRGKFFPAGLAMSVAPKQPPVIR